MESQIEEIRKTLQNEQNHLNKLEIETIELRRRLNEDRTEQWRKFETVEEKRRNQLLKLEEDNNILRMEVLNLTECCETFQSINYTQRKTIEDLMSRIAEMQSNTPSEGEKTQFVKADNKCACRDINVENSECCQTREINEELWIMVDDLTTIISELEQKIFQQKECLEARIGVLEQRMGKTANSLLVLVESCLLRLSRSVSTCNFSPENSVSSSFSSPDDRSSFSSVHSTKFPLSRPLLSNEPVEIFWNDQEWDDNQLQIVGLPYHQTQSYNPLHLNELITGYLPNNLNEPKPPSVAPPLPFSQDASVPIVSSRTIQRKHLTSTSSDSSSSLCYSDDIILAFPSSKSPPLFTTHRPLHYQPQSQKMAPPLSAPSSPTESSHDQQKYIRYSFHL